MCVQPNIRRFFTPIQPNARQPVQDVVYQELPPHPSLQPFIYCYWQFRTTAPLPESFNHTIVADGCIDIFFDLQQPKHQYVMGFCNSYTEFTLSQSFNYAGIRFLPGMFAQLFKISSAELSNKVAPLADIAPAVASFINGRMEPNGELTEIKQQLDAYFIRFVHDGDFDWDGRLYESLQIILSRQGVVDILKDLDTGISPRQLRRLFEFYIGDTPKSFCQVVRFQNLLKAKPSTQSLRQNKLFFDLGYYDQSHFIKEFKKLHGITPAQAFRC